MHAHLCAHTLTNAHKTRKRATHIRTHYTLTSMLNNIQILAHFQSGGLAEDNRPANDFQLTKRKLTYQSRIRRRLLQPLHSRFTNREIQLHMIYTYRNWILKTKYFSKEQEKTIQFTMVLLWRQNHVSTHSLALPSPERNKWENKIHS